MISVLILEDKIERAKSISQALQKSGFSSESQIFHASEIISAKKKLSEKRFDLLLLDLQIPIRFDQEPKNDGGVNFLKEISSGPSFKLPKAIIAYSADAALVDANSGFFRDNAIIALNFLETSDQFERVVLNKARYLCDEADRANQGDQRSFFYDVALICALESIEHEAIKQLPGRWEPLIMGHDPSVYFTGNFEKGPKKLRVVSVCCPQMGMVPTAVVAMRLISHFCPKLFIMTGIAGGCGDAAMGDLIVANPSWDYDSGKFKESSGVITFSPDPRQISIDPGIHSRLQTLISDSTFLHGLQKKWPAEKPAAVPKLFIGPLGSGGAVVSANEKVREIQAHSRKMIGLDMETFGFYFACQNSIKPTPLFFSVKSVSDFADKKKGDHFQKYAAFLAAQFAFEAALEIL